MTERFASTRIAVLACLPAVAVLLTACTWKPRVVHPDLFATGRVMEKGHVEAGAQIAPGATVRVGLGFGIEAKAYGGYVGEDIYGGALSLTRALTSRGPTYSAVSVGYGAMAADGHPYSANRAHVGYTVSFFTPDEHLALHLPMKVYWMRYDWTRQMRGERRYVDDGTVFVPGMSISVQGKYLAARLAVNFPAREHIGQTELKSNFGAQVAIRF